MTSYNRGDQQPYQDNGKDFAMDYSGEIAGNCDAKGGEHGKKQGMAEATMADRMGIRKPAQHQDIKVRQNTPYQQDRQPVIKRHCLSQGGALQGGADCSGQPENVRRRWACQ
jgi:hypothetical protein